MSDIPSERPPFGPDLSLEHRVLPIDDLPALDADLVVGEHYLSHRVMRPAYEGFSFHNVPVLGIGLDINYATKQARLAVSSAEEFNAVIDTHNPGGLKYMPVEGEVGATRYLQLLADGYQPRGNNPAPGQGNCNYYKFFKRSIGSGYAVRSLPNYVVSSMRQHDVVDHAGAGEMDANGVGQTSTTAEASLELPERLQKLQCLELDSVLSKVSYYGLVSVRSRNRIDSSCRMFFRDAIVGHTRTINEQVPRSAELHLDFDALDQNIARMQSLPKAA